MYIIFYYDDVVDLYLCIMKEVCGIVLNGGRSYKIVCVYYLLYIYNYRKSLVKNIYIC